MITIYLLFSFIMAVGWVYVIIVPEMKKAQKDLLFHSPVLIFIIHFLNILVITIMWPTAFTLYWRNPTKYQNNVRYNTKKLLKEILKCYIT